MIARVGVALLALSIVACGKMLYDQYATKLGKQLE